MMHHHTPEFARLVKPGAQLIVVDGDHEMVCTVDSLQCRSPEAEPNRARLTIVSVNTAPPEAKASIWRELLTRSFWTDLAVGL